MWFEEPNRYFCQIENFPNEKINDRSFKNPTPDVQMAYVILKETLYVVIESSLKARKAFIPVFWLAFFDLLQPFCGLIWIHTKPYFPWIKLSDFEKVFEWVQDSYCLVTIALHEPLSSIWYVMPQVWTMMEIVFIWARLNLKMVSLGMGISISRRSYLCNRNSYSGNTISMRGTEPWITILDKIIPHMLPH